VVSDYNGSDRHKRGKQRLASICRRHGYLAAGDKDDEFVVVRPGGTSCYVIDVIASNGVRVLAIEIDGYKGHSTRRGLLKDMHRTAEICALVKDIECYRFAFWQLANCPDSLIAQELGLIENAQRSYDHK